MKKSRLLLLPLVILLTGCNNQIEIGFSNGDTHSAGPDRETSSKEGGVISYSYMNNATLDNTGLNKATLTFANINTSKSDIEDKELIMSYLNVDQDILTGVDNPQCWPTTPIGLPIHRKNTAKWTGLRTTVLPLGASLRTSRRERASSTPTRILATILPQ